MYYPFVNYADLHQRHSHLRHRSQGEHVGLSVAKIACLCSAGVFFATSAISAIATVQCIEFASTLYGVSIATTHNISVAAVLPHRRAATTTAVSCKYTSDCEEADRAIGSAHLRAGEITLRREDHRSQHLLCSMLDGLQN